MTDRAWRIAAAAAATLVGVAGALLGSYALAGGRWWTRVLRGLFALLPAAVLALGWAAIRPDPVATPASRPDPTDTSAPRPDPTGTSALWGCQATRAPDNRAESSLAWPSVWYYWSCSGLCSARPTRPSPG